ncbi:MAG: hypothetical protein WD335_02410 [Candidatus Paceibacterota bacterium]
MYRKIAIFSIVSFAFVGLVISTIPVAEASKVGEIIKVNSPPGATQAQDYNATRSNKPTSVRDEDSDDDGDGHADPEFREGESSPEHEFTNPVGIDIQAGGDGVLVSVEPPNSDPVVIFHEKNLFTTVEPPNSDPVVILQENKG